MATANPLKPAPAKPEYLTLLEAAYGAPSQAGFGSAVFHEQMKAGDDLEQAALAKYRYFTGDLWERWGEEAWIGPGKRSTLARLGPSRISWPSCAVWPIRMQPSRCR